MSKKYSLIISGNNSFSLSNDTDSDAVTDYFPGIWALKTQKSALRFAKQILAEGNEIRVTNYDNPKYHPLANKFIKELGLSQVLFTEPKAVKQGVVTNGMPSTLGALKKFLTVGSKIRFVNFKNPDRSRETEVVEIHNNNFVTRKGEAGKSWMEFGKASDWSFDNLGATTHFINCEGQVVPSIRIEYM